MILNGRQAVRAGCSPRSSQPQQSFIVYPVQGRALQTPQWHLTLKGKTGPCRPEMEANYCLVRTGKVCDQATHRPKVVERLGINNQVPILRAGCSAVLTIAGSLRRACKTS